MNLSRRSLFAMLFAAPLMKLMPKTRPDQNPFAYYKIGRSRVLFRPICVSHVNAIRERGDDGARILWDVNPKSAEMAYAYHTDGSALFFDDDPYANQIAQLSHGDRS